jgi:hypothetical protein
VVAWIGAGCGTCDSGEGNAFAGGAVVLLGNAGLGGTVGGGAPIDVGAGWAGALA